MLGDTLTVTLDGSGGTAKVLSKINQDGYAAEYLLKEATMQHRALVRHSKESPKSNGVNYDRHNVLFETFVYPTEAAPNGFTRQISMTIRCQPEDALADVVDLGEALTYWATDTIQGKLVGWES